MHVPAWHMNHTLSKGWGETDEHSKKVKFTEIRRLYLDILIGDFIS